jgi:hypothetical protein
VTADASPVGGTLVFTSAGGGTMVSEAGDRRDARTASGPDPSRSAFDLPPLDADKDPDVGSRVN